MNDPSRHFFRLHGRPALPLFLALAALLSAGACLEDPPEGPSDPVPLEKPIPVDTANLDSVYLAAQQEFIAGNYDRAAELYKEVLFQQKSARAWHALGDIHMVTMEFNTAVSDYQKALEIEPNKRMSVMRLGQAYQRSGKFLEAVESYQKAQKMDESDALAFRLEAEVLLPLGRLDEAIGRYAKAASLEKDAAKRVADFSAMANAAKRQAKFDDASNYLNRAIAETPSVQLYADLAEVRLSAKDLTGARDAWKKAAEMEKSDPFYWEAVAETELKLGDSKAARAAFEASLAVKNRASIQLALARMDLSEGKQDNAKVRLDAALGVTEGSAEDVTEAAHLAAQLRDWALAEKLLMTLDGAPDAEDQTALWGLIAALRREKGDEAGMALACAAAKKKFVESLPASQKKIYEAMERDFSGELDEPLPEVVTPEDVQAVNLQCQTGITAATKAVEEARKATDPQKRGDSPVSEQTVKLCVRAQKMNEILMRSDKPTAERMAADGSMSLTGVALPKEPACPPDSVPWKKAEAAPDTAK